MPRAAKIQLSDRMGWFVFGGLFFLVGLPFLVIGIYTGVRQWHFPGEAATVPGMVLTKSTNSKDRYTVTYRFTTGNGQLIEGSASVSGEVWDRLEERGPIQVQYVPHSPRRHRVEGQDSDWATAFMMGTIGGVFTSLGGFVLIMAFFRLRHARGRGFRA